MATARKQKEMVTATQQDIQRAEDIVQQLDKLQSFFAPCDPLDGSSVDPPSETSP